MSTNYDHAAYYYDGLSRLVFGGSLIKAQVHLLGYIPEGARVLIIGGGTGQLLEEIARLRPSGLTITYIEISEKMTATARKRNMAGNHVTFINKAAEQVEPGQHEVIITPFLFDNFTDKNMAVLFNHLHQVLKPGGLWLNTDFQLTGKWWQPILLKSMLVFFKIVCRVEGWHIPDVGRQFGKHSYQLTEEKTFFGDFVITQLYRKAV